MSSAPERITFRSIALAMAICLLGSAFLERAAASAASYPADIRGAWSERILTEWMSKGWLTGYPDGTAKPKKEVTRAEFFSLANKSLGYADEAATGFGDVVPGTWKAKQVAIAVKAGYAEAYPDGTIQPDRKVNREEVSVMVAKAFGLEPSPGETSAFTDAASVSNAGKGSVGALVAKGVLKGYPDGSFRPKKVITREEAVVILDGALKKLKRKSGEDRVFAAAGAYGPAEGRETVAGDAIVEASGVTLRNLEIQGDLLLAASIGEGEAALDNVKVKGTVTVNGGGPNSIYFEDSEIDTLIVDKKNGAVRIVATGSTLVKRADLRSGAKLESDASKDTGFGAVHLTKEMPSGSKIILLGEFAETNVASSNVELELTEGTIRELNVLSGASGNTMSLNENTRVVDLTLEEEAKIRGPGVIDRAVVGDRAKDSTFERVPGKLEGGGAPSPSPSPGTGGGGGGNQDTTPPAAPAVTGVQDQRTYAGPVTPNWSDASGTTSTATLVKDGSDKAGYTRNTEIAEDGSYILSVTARKNSNGARAVTTIRFTIDSVPPAAPTIEGVADGGRYFSASPTWTDAPGTVSEAALSKDGHGAESYERGTLIVEEGNYALTVKSTKANRLTAATTIRFAIDSSSAVPALIEGVEEGGTYSSAIVTWTDATGMNSTATLAKDGGTAASFNSGTEISEEGDYVLTVTTRNELSNETVEQRVHFTIDAGRPQPVEINITGALHQEGQAYYTARLHWTDPVGTASTAMLKKDDADPIPYERNSLIDQDGDYVLTVTSTKLSSGLTATATRAFRVNTGPTQPIVTGFADNQVYFGPVTMSWEPSPGTAIAGTSLRNLETGEMMENISSPATLENDGTYEFSVNVERGGAEVPYRYQFVIAGIRGLSDGETYPSVTPAWVEPIGFGGGSGSEAVLSKNGEPAVPYTKGTTIDEEGEYELTVTWHTRNNQSATQSVNFTIAPPIPTPDISVLGSARAIEGEYYYYTATLHWTDPPGMTSTATLKTGDADPVPFDQRNPIEEDGEYVVTVTWTDLSTGMSLTGSREFKVHIGAARPHLSVEWDYEIYYEPVTISWTARDHTQINWTLLENRNTNERIDDVPNPMMVMEDGEYEFKVEVNRDDETRQYSHRFVIAGIRGVENRGVYIGGVTPDWLSQRIYSNGNEMWLYKDGEQVPSYKKGDTISEPGEYELTVNWLVYDYHSWQTVRFTIIEPVEVTGVEHGGTYLSAAPTWADAPAGRAIRATLAKDGGEAAPYARGTAITEDGSYVLALTTTVHSSGGEIQQIIPFTIDTVPPGEPTIAVGGNFRDLSGVMAYYSASLTWTEPTGTASTAMLRKDGGEPVPYAMGTLIDRDGDYELVVTTTKLSNGLTSTAARAFHVSTRPAQPELTGFSDNAILFGPVEIAWTIGDGTTFDWVSLRNVNTNERFDSPSNPTTIEQLGEYEFSAGVRKGGEIDRHDYRFIVAGIGGVEEGGVYPNATPDWYEPEHFGEVEAALSKDGEPVASYEKGTPITEPGEYVLTVTWRIDAESSETMSVRFTVEEEGPAAATIELNGRPNGGYYFDVSPVWTDSPGTTSTATLSKDGAPPEQYERGTLIDEDGEYVLIVTTTKTSNGLTAEATVTFTIDTRPV